MGDPAVTPEDKDRLSRHIHILTPGPEMRDRLWHVAYSRWYDHREAENRMRSAAWGWVADRLCAR